MLHLYDIWNFLKYIIYGAIQILECEGDKGVSSIFDDKEWQIKSHGKIQKIQVRKFAGLC